jgi:hypothetical protein
VPRTHHGHGWLPEARAPDANLDHSTNPHTRTYWVLYLGDGWLSRDPRAYRLRIVQDLRYPNVIELAITSIKRVRDEAMNILEIFKQACDAAQIAHSSSKFDTISIAPVRGRRSA